LSALYNYKNIATSCPFFAFESACSLVLATKNNKWKEQFLNDIFQNESDIFDNNHLFDVECVDRVVSDMKRGKAASLDA